MNELALFAGAGGGILGGKLLGWRTVCAVEWEPYAAGVLAQRQNDKVFEPFPIWDDVQTFDGKPWNGIVDVVSGGFPCQDISVAGKGAGIEGQKSGMWKHMARIVGEVRPQYVFVENSPAIITRGLGTVLNDLAALGYDCKWTVLGAADVGAPHQRDRFWLVANTKSHGRKQGRKPKDILSQDGRQNGSMRSIISRASERPKNMAEVCSDVSNTSINRFRKRPDKQISGKHKRTPNACTDGAQISLDHANGVRELQPQGSELYERGRFGNGSSDVSHPNSSQRQGIQFPKRSQQESTDFGNASWWAIEPPLGRMANGVAHRANQLKAIGNGQVPAVAAAAFKYLTEQA